MSQLEKEARAAVDSARASVEATQKESRTAADSTRSGAIDLTVGNVLDTDGGYDAFVDEEARKTAVTSQTCAIMNVAPGFHELAVTASIEGRPVHASEIVNVAAGAVVKVSMRLARTKAASTL